MKVYKIEPLNFASNTFAVTEDGVNCILIDCAEERVIERCRALALKPVAVFLTHGHFDHVGGCAALQAAGAKIYASKEEAALTFSGEYLTMFGGVYVPSFAFDGAVSEGEIEACGIEIKVLSTPGHSAGGLSYVIGDGLFTGDTLFAGSIGRSDLPTGDYAELVKSVKKLYALPGEYRIYCGHGEDSSLDRERAFNPYVRA